MVNKVQVYSETTKTLLSYVDSNQRKNLNEKAFAEICNVFLRFLDEYRSNLEQKVSQRKEIHVVSNASPGHGKTTTLMAIQQYLANEPEENTVPLLIALRDTEHIAEIFNKVKTFNEDDEYFVQYIDADNKNKYPEKELKRFQIIIITHQRLMNLALGLGDANAFTKWLPSKYGNMGAKSKKRVLIIDEMPTFVDSAIFDISSQDVFRN